MLNGENSPKKILQQGLTRRQRTALGKSPAPEHIRTRREENRELFYLEGWYVIAEANRIFGAEHWDRITLTTNCVWQGRRERQASCAYTARVRVCIRAGSFTLVREGTGFGQAISANIGEAHGQALKAAETDATKRALATLGAPFGLTLYDRDNLQMQDKKNPETVAPDKSKQSSGSPINGTVSPGGGRERMDPHIRSTLTPLWIIQNEVGEPADAFRDPILCCSCLRRTIESTQNKEELETIFTANRRLLARLTKERPDLRGADRHYSEILTRLFQARLKRLARAETRSALSGEKVEKAESDSIDAFRDSRVATET